MASSKKPTRSGKLSLYSNLAGSKSVKRTAKKTSAQRERERYLASLPKNPVDRFFFHLQPRRVFHYWFSKHGLIMALKIIGIVLLLLCLFIGGLFAYYRKDLDQISPSGLAKQVQSSVTTYTDRNGVVLWQDTGGGNYKIVVDSDELSPYLKEATVAVEDKNFYKDPGVSVTGIARAALNNIFGGSTQGASTLTEQLIKQVYFSDEASDRGLTGIPRKIKEIILSLEVERMYSKDQILSLYLNESPYGGPRNGAESAAEAYFGIHAKDLSIAQAALLAAIPQDPSYYNPYNVDGNQALLDRWKIVLNDMVAQHYITQAQADDAKKTDILDTIKPQTTDTSNIKAGNFVEMVRQELIDQLGANVVGKGGLTVKTTLDYRVQSKLQDAMDTEFSGSAPARYGFTNGAATVEDTQTGQIIALMGSRSFDYPGFGQDNEATAFIQPGSTIKPLEYTQLFQQKASGQPNFGSGSKLVNNDIDSIYGASLSNAYGDPFNNGAVSIRTALANSWNIPAVEAMAINGIQPTLNTIHALGGTSYCTDGVDQEVGLAAAIGGCGIKQVDLVNAYASLGRGGVYKPQSSILQVTNASGQTLMKWSDTAGKQVVNPQAAYVTSDILHDDNARTFVGTHRLGMYIPGVDSAAKTGTSNDAANAALPKDIWMVNYSQALTMAVWLGNPDTTPLKTNATSIVPGPIVDTTLQYAYKTIYADEGKWKPGDWIPQPAGIQRVGCSTSTLVTGNGKFDQACGEVYPSYYNSSQGITNATFDSVSKDLATACTPDSTKVTVPVIKITLAPPLSSKALYVDPKGAYALPDTKGNWNDSVHLCDSNGSPINPVTVGTPSYSPVTNTLSVTASSTNTPLSVVFTVNGQQYTASLSTGSTYTATYSGPPPDSGDSVTVTDAQGYTSTVNFN